MNFCPRCASKDTSKPNPLQNQTHFKTKPNKAKTATIIMNTYREKSNSEKLKKPHSNQITCKGKKLKFELSI